MHSDSSSQLWEESWSMDAAGATIFRADAYLGFPNCCGIFPFFLTNTL